VYACRLVFLAAKNDRFSEELDLAVGPSFLMIEQRDRLVRQEGVLELPWRSPRYHVLQLPHRLRPVHHHRRQIRPLTVDAAAATARRCRRGGVGRR